MKKFQIKPAVYFGAGSIQVLGELAYKSALVITDPFMVKSGNIKPVMEQLRTDAQVTVFDHIYPDPDTALIAEGMEAFIKTNPDLIIACGGGSTIDAAKSILYCSGKIAEKEKKRLFVAIPTTSGTGSEVTNFSVITMDQRKIPVIDDALLPDIAVLDGGLTKTVPPAITADTGMDVLTHALEAYVSTDASNFSDALAEKAVELVFEYLPAAVRHGDDLEARGFLHDASCMAGMAFTNASLGINHSLAHAIGGVLHVPHGRANAILLPWVLGYNAADQRARERYGTLAWRLGLSPKNAENGSEVLQTAVRMLSEAIKIPTSFKEAGVKETDFYDNLDRMTTAALEDNCTKTNPLQPLSEELKNLYIRSYTGEK